jgi:alpha-L-fucosidase
MKMFRPTDLTRRPPRTGIVCVLFAFALGGISPNALAESATVPIDYATVHVISPEDSPATIVEKAAKVLPRSNQIEWMRLERTFFLHFGPNTFRGVEWGDGRESPAIFNPTELDANQWVSAMKNAGCKLLILVAKHHDGLCFWPTRYTQHSIASSPWRGGKGDMVREVAEAARAQGIKLGLYLSPADLYQLRTNPKNPAGYYGNGSPKVRSTIPTDPASFQKDPAQGRTPTPGFDSHTYEVDDYNRYFLNQLYETLTEYGPISVAWFDGANPDPSVHQTYDYAAWYDLIRKLQPGAVISVKGPDVRWVGNEGGYGRTTEWSVLPLPEPPDRHTWPDRQDNDLGSRAKLKAGSHLWWYPAEVNTPILNGWFWSAEKRAKSPAELVDYFYRSVGRNGVMLLNLSPDTRGLIPDDQLSSLRKMSHVIADTFARNLAAGAKLTADSSHSANSPSLALDRNLDTWWEAAPGHTAAIVTLTLPARATFDVVSLQEAVAQRSQRIEFFVIETWDGSAWTAPIAVEEQTTIGHKRLVRLSVPVTTDQLRIRITGSRLEPTLAEIGLFKQSLPKEPTISDRNREGTITLTHPHGLPIVYTLDGSELTARSSTYRAPISLPQGGTVHAAVMTSEGQLGLTASKSVVGLAPTGWKVVTPENPGANVPDFPATNAIDADARTLWQTRAMAGQSAQPTLTIDMGGARRVGGFAYLPRQDWVFKGVVDRYKFETSLDGRQWDTQVESGTFGNIRNNPMFQEVRFAPVEARYFRFTALHAVDDDGWIGAAEITVLPAR